MSSDARLYSYTLFLDILGYSSRISKIYNNEKAGEIFALLDSIEARIKEYCSIASAHDAYKEYDLHYSFISDAIVLSFTPKNNLNISLEEKLFLNQTTLEFIFTWIMNVQIDIIFQAGLFLRGGISIKEIYWQNEKVVGPGLIEAYQLEQQMAEHPRIILSPELSANSELIDLINHINEGGDSAYHKHTLLRRDNDIYYYNLVGRLLARVVYDHNALVDEVKNIEALTYAYLLEQKFIIEHFLIENNSKYVDKYKWLKNDHNFSITEFAHDNEVELTSFEQYLI